MRKQPQENRFNERHGGEMNGLPPLKKEVSRGASLPVLPSMPAPCSRTLPDFKQTMPRVWFKNPVWSVGALFILFLIAAGLFILAQQKTLQTPLAQSNQEKENSQVLITEFSEPTYIVNWEERGERSQFTLPEEGIKSLSDASNEKAKALLQIINANEVTTLKEEFDFKHELDTITCQGESFSSGFYWTTSDTKTGIIVFSQQQVSDFILAQQKTLQAPLAQSNQEKENSQMLITELGRVIMELGRDMGQEQFIACALQETNSQSR